MNRPAWLVIHHSATRGPDTAAAAVVAFRRYHQVVRGWRDIGYHLVIGRNGDFAAGRDERMTGAHARGFNAKSIGICLVGDFDIEMPSREQMVTLVEQCRLYMTRYGIKPEQIIGHRETYLLLRGVSLDAVEAMSLSEIMDGAEKSCPGLDFDMAKLRRQVAGDPAIREDPPDEVKSVARVWDRMIAALEAALRRVREARRA